MALTVPYVGEVYLLNRMFYASGVNYTLRLYQAISSPISNSTVLADFTECNFTGYVAKTLTSTSWSPAATVAGITSTNYPTQSWTCGATGNTVLGYYVVDPGGTVVLFAEAFSTSRTLVSGDTLNLTLNFTLA
jgi:hypothetical protein